jgi:hypothetical protein
MQSKNTPEEPLNLPRKPWQAPQCVEKTWKTPKVTALEFRETKDGYLRFLPESSSGTMES